MVKATGEVKLRTHMACCENPAGGFRSKKKYKGQKGRRGDAGEWRERGGGGQDPPQRLLKPKWRRVFCELLKHPATADTYYFFLLFTKNYN